MPAVPGTSRSAFLRLSPAKVVTLALAAVLGSSGLAYAGGTSAPVGSSAAGSVAATAVATAKGLVCTHAEKAPKCSHHDGSSQTVAATGPSTYAPEVAVGCAGDGRSGNRVQVVYARQSDRTDRYSTVVAGLRRQVNVANGVFHRSSGGKRQLRVVTTSRCVLAVERLTLTPAQASSFTETVKALRASGRNRMDRKYLVFVDNSRGCGLGEMYLDNRVSSQNRNNDGNTHAALYTPCWNGVTAAHELVHMLGGVQPSAPHSTGNYGHCTDKHDVMCYADGSGKTMSVRCSSSHATMLDCGKNDYFNVAPAAGSYLTKYWNTARNSFLVGGGPAVPSAPSAPRSVTSSRSADRASVGWVAPEQMRSGVAAYDVVDLAAGSAVVATVSGAVRSASVTLTPWRTYRLAVVARNAVGRSAPAGSAQHMVGTAPASPSGVVGTYTAKTSDVQIRLSWQAPQHATSYRIYRDGALVGSASTSGWSDTSQTQMGQTYSYTVRATNAWGTSPASAGATATAL